jgi:hypothetical protein
MTVPSEVRQVAGQMQLQLVAQEDRKVRPRPASARLDQKAAMAPFEINLSGAQILAGFASALSFLAIVFWALIKLWLFEQ